MRRELIKLLLTAAVPLTALCLTPWVYAEGTLGGTYYLQSTGGVGSAPFPFDPYGDSVPVVQVSPGVYLVEDGADSQNASPKASIVTAVQADGTGTPSLPDGSGSNTNWSPTPMGGGQPINYASGLWIECTNQGGGNVGLNLHNTINGDNYQLLFTTNLLNDPWDLGQIIYGASDGETPFPNPVSITNSTAMFFKAHHAYPVIEILVGQYAVEPTNAVSGQNGTFDVYDEVGATNDVTVYYSVSGIATNGVDYVTIGNALTIPANQYHAVIQIVPIDVGLTPDKSIILTLVQNTNYLIDSTYYYASNVLYANPDLIPIAHGDYEQVCPNSSTPFSLYGDVYNPSQLVLSFSIATNAMHGRATIDSSSGTATYTSSGFEGIDSFAYTATSGGYTSAPAIVTVTVADTVTANPVEVQTCRTTNVTVYLDGGDVCSESLTFTNVGNPAHGMVTNFSGGVCEYKSTDPNFTGTDSFVYSVTASTGESATSVVTVTVGDSSVTANDQNVLTGTNTPVAITPTGADSESCVESNRWTFSVSSAPANGTLSGSGANLTYTPSPNFEGIDSFQFTASDGVWTSSPATVTIYVVGAAYLTYLNQCDPFGGFGSLAWTEDSTTTALVQNDLGGNSFFAVGRSTNPNGPFSPIGTSSGTAPWTYSDFTATPGQIYYYVVALDFTDSDSGLTYQSAFSNTNSQMAQSTELIAPSSPWYVTDWNEISPTNINMNASVFTIYTNPPNMVKPVFTNWVTGPFSVPTNYAALYGPANPPQLVPASSNPGWAWTNQHTIWAHCDMNLTGYTPQQLSNVVYSTAIDNGYLLYINHTNVNQNPPDVYWNGAAYWGAQTQIQGGQLFSRLPNLVAGTNSVDVVFWGDGNGNEYFSMVVTTNTCGY
jgi:hypothetical protein